MNKKSPEMILNNSGSRISQRETRRRPRRRESLKRRFQGVNSLQKRIKRRMRMKLVSLILMWVSLIMVNGVSLNVLGIEILRVWGLEKLRDNGCNKKWISRGS